MSSSSDADSSPPSLEELTIRSTAALLLPWVLSMLPTSNSTPREVTVFLHQPTLSISLIEGNLDIDSILFEIASKSGTAPASKASIESLSGVKVSDPGQECPIYLVEYKVNTEVKEMPCKHRFHSDCIGKWLGIHGSCPICRFSMPVDEKKENEEIDGVEWSIHAFVARRRGERGMDSEMDIDDDSD